MPFLRFTRDKRGYETTALVHAFRGRHGRTRQKLLYWFRTPPSVKVGRPALDEEAIRFIEEHNPEIDFDWQKILAATPPAAAPAEDVRGRRGVRRGKPERRSQSRQAAAPPRQSSSPPAAIVKDERVASEAGHEQIDAVGESEPSEAAGEPVSESEAFELEAEAPESEAGEDRYQRANDLREGDRIDSIAANPLQAVREFLSQTSKHCLGHRYRRRHSEFAGIVEQATGIAGAD